VSLQRTVRIALGIALAVCLLGHAATPAFAAPSTAQTAEDRARVSAALAKFDAAQKKAAGISARVEKSSNELDAVISEQETIWQRLETRAVAMYRSGDDPYITLFLGAETLEDFSAMWDLLERLSEQDAEDAQALDVARVAAERSAKSLVSLQSQEAQAVDETAREVATARKALATSTAALNAYNARVANAKKQAAALAKKRSAELQKRSGAGSWLKGLASHYSKDFSGHGASGAAITPYSMMVAHKTLPFHTLIEFEYNGRRAVASVEDRGPYTKGRVFDLGPGVVRALGFNGVHDVRYRVIGR
jgi:rare lipoprotein A (peptidoglycan hydrolase)